jgi:hypothetical protein
MQVSGVIQSFSSRLDGNFQSAASPPSLRQLVDSVHTRPPAEFQEGFAASKFTPDAAKTVDVAV